MNHLHPKAKKLIAHSKKQGVPINELPVDKAREAFKKSSLRFALRAEVHAHVNDLSIANQHADIPIRCYYPKKENVSYPILVYFHGGGFVVGGLDEVDQTCRLLCAKTEALVVSVGYRLAPEHKHPAAIEDAIHTVEWLHEYADDLNGDKTRIAIAGDSSGGNLTAVLGQHFACHQFIKILYQVMICPSLDYSREHPSKVKFASDSLLDKELRYWFAYKYLKEEHDWSSTLVSPLLTEDITLVPPALILTAEYDPLIDEAKLYVDKLKQSNIPVEHICFPGLVHGFFHMHSFFNESIDAIDLISNRLAKIFNSH